MSRPDLAYFQTRAEAELELAQRASHPKAVRAHYLLAELYLDKVYGQPGDAEHSAPEPAPNRLVPTEMRARRGRGGRAARRRHRMNP